MQINFEQKLEYGVDICEGMCIRSKFDRIYPFTTENISGYINEFDLYNKSLLTIGSSNDQVINAAMHNCYDISVVDICPFTKFYFYLKKAAVLSLNYDEFLSFFCYRNFYPHLKDNNNVFKKEIYLKIKKTLRLLDYESYLFWDELFSCYESLAIRKELFEYDEYNLSVLKEINLYMTNEKQFDICKNKIKIVNPKFIIGDIKNIKLDRKYDNIWLSNLGQYMKIEDLKSIVDELFKNLNKEGRMLVCYLYRTIKNTVYRDEWAEIYNLKEVYSNFKDYLLKLNSFIGVDGINKNWDDIKDSVLIYKKK